MHGKSAGSWNPFFLQSKLSGKRKSITFYRSGVSNLRIPMETSSLSDDSCDHFGSDNFANTIARKLLDCWLLFPCAVYS
uniref:Uncharacterized protein n=1 Tax=Pseudonaja textilis TaxID=8673 RepID=A0A670YAD0_PSETE